MPNISDTPIEINNAKAIVYEFPDKESQVSIVCGTLQALRLQANNILKKLNESQQLPHLDKILSDIFFKRNVRTFTKPEDFTEELRIRSFGYRHAIAMEAWLTQQQQIWNDWNQEYENFKEKKAKEVNEQVARRYKKSYSQRQIDLKDGLNSYKNGAPQLVKQQTMTALAETEEQYKKRLFNRRYDTALSEYRLDYLKQKEDFELRNAPTFVEWASPVTLSPVVNPENTKKHITRWLFESWEVPQLMNCWEAVLYGGFYGDLYDKDYFIWAVSGGYRYLTKIMEEVQQKAKDSPLFYYSPARPVNQPKKHLAPPLLAQDMEVPAGRVMLLNDMSHVALSTGKMRRNVNPEAIQAYGQMGHEIMELDGDAYESAPLNPIPTVRKSTIEDRIFAKGNSYKLNLYIGSMPNCDKVEKMKFSYRRLQDPWERKQRKKISPVKYEKSSTITQFYAVRD